MTDEHHVGLSYCARCRCGVPIDEWRVSPTLTAWKHVGPMRDHKIDRYVEPDELASTRCGWAKKVPVKI